MTLSTRLGVMRRRSRQRRSVEQIPSSWPRTPAGRGSAGRGRILHTRRFRLSSTFSRVKNPATCFFFLSLSPSLLPLSLVFFFFFQR